MISFCGFLSSFYSIHSCEAFFLFVSDKIACLIIILSPFANCEIVFYSENVIFVLFLNFLLVIKDNLLYFLQRFLKGSAVAQW